MNMANAQEAREELALAMRSLFGDKLAEVILFGSYARNQQDEESDIDILVLVNEDKMALKAYSMPVVEMVTEINLQYDVVLSVVLQSMEEYEEYKEVLPFFINVRQEGFRFMFEEKRSELARYRLDKAKEDCYAAEELFKLNLFK